MSVKINRTKGLDTPGIFSPTVSITRAATTGLGNNSRVTLTDTSVDVSTFTGEPGLVCKVTATGAGKLVSSGSRGGCVVSIPRDKKTHLLAGYSIAITLPLIAPIWYGLIAGILAVDSNSV